MPDNDTFDSLDEELNNTFNNSEENSDAGDFNNETETESDETTLEELIQENTGKTEEKSNQTNQTINNTEQNTKQFTNRSRKSNNSEDLVDGNGNVIAKAGAERRFYEENVKLKRERDLFNSQVIPKLKENYNAMVTKMQAYDETFKNLRAEDLTPEEINIGINLIREWKKSPEETLKFLLTQAKSSGINIDSGSSGVDTAAINKMLDDKLRPFVEERENIIRQKQIRSEATNIYNDFMNRYPDAKAHQKELAYLVRKNPNASLDSIYYQIKNYYLENGYDFNTPLEEILANKSKQQKTSNFNMINTNQNMKTEEITQKIAPINESYDNIIRSVLKGKR